MMKVTVKIKRVFTDKVKLKAIASACFDDCFIVNSIKLIEGEKGYFISMPTTRMPDGKYFDHCHPITKEFGEHLTDLVIDAYNNY